MNKTTIATPAMLAALEPGELLVKLMRDGWTIPPDHVALAQANRARCRFEPEMGVYRGGVPNDRQTECLEGSA
jgi:hypothetical protein